MTSHTNNLTLSNYHSLSGDSGAPLWSGNTIFGIHSGQAGFTDGKKQTYGAHVADDVAWIQNFANSYWGPSLGNLFRSWEGGKEAKKKLGLKTAEGSAIF